MNTNFYVGIIECRDDPLKLGRYQVRVFGVHSELKDDLPTEDLPWAIPLVNSASISGIGKSSAGYVEGTMVFVFFQDGESKQSPIIMGAMHGIPVAKYSFNGQNLEERFDSTYKQNIDSNGSVVSTVSPTASDTLLDTAGNPVSDAPVAAPEVVGSFYKPALKEALGKKESSNNYAAVNRFNYIGKYQMGADMLIDLGYVRPGSKLRDLDNSEVWTGKDGIKSKSEFLGSPTVQESAMDQELALNEKRLRRMGVIDETSTTQEIAGYLATSHLLGTGGAQQMKRGVVKSDANGVTGNEYYKLGYAAVSGESPTILPQNTGVENAFRKPSKDPGVGIVSTGTVPRTQSSFGDPAGEYPRYLNEQDTNRLSRNQNISKTIVNDKDYSRDIGVRVANSSKTWDQPIVPFNPTYPFNNVFESESGHVIEIDDSPNNERLHQYHTSGTFTEIDRNGTNVRKIVGDTYEIWERNGYVHIKGSVNITVEGDANINVANQCNLEVNGDFNARVGGSVNWSVGGDWKQKIGGKESHTTSGDFAVDGSNVHLNSGVSDAGGLTMTSKSTGVVEFPELTIEPRDFLEISAFETDEMSADEAKEYRRKLQDSGVTDVNVVEAVEGEVVSVKASAVDDQPVSCDMFIQGNIDIKQFITPNYRLFDFTKGQQIKSQAGLLDVEIACNLKALAANVLENVRVKYPDCIITSGLRAIGSNPTSQHPLGMAVDVQFTNKKSSDYLEIAKYLAENIVFDQLILEYTTDRRINGAPVTWIHLSYSRSGNRKQVFTMNNHTRVSNFGELKAIT